MKGGDTLQELPKSRQRFDNLVCVLGQQFFSKGRHYWEVNVKNKIKWTLGICKDSVCRQGEIIVSPEAGFWTLCLNRSNDYQALANPRITLHLEEPPEIIGIFLDYKDGRVSFYNVTNLSHIYTYRKCFTEALRPYFYPGPPYNGQNEHPLTILSLRHINKPGRRYSVWLRKKCLILNLLKLGRDIDRYSWYRYGYGYRYNIYLYRSNIYMYIYRTSIYIRYNLYID